MMYVMWCFVFPFPFYLLKPFYLLRFTVGIIILLCVVYYNNMTTLYPGTLVTSVGKHKVPVVVF